MFKTVCTRYKCNKTCLGSEEQIPNLTVAPSVARLALGGIGAVH